MNHPKKTVVVSFIGILLLTGGGKLLSGHLPSYRQLFAIWALFLFLSLGAEITPELAATLALLILVTAGLQNFSAISGFIKKFVG